ncbi:MAG: hypothetical protein N0E48_24800 [Candidatus Thiodiazotropha endolucinida]|nr:hypothetical protein [Candidatus Thiodiazotropha taylori]MCW4346546.1 hypothetical protein [Candidatus Thiodiazotropha endolucinida]
MEQQTGEKKYTELTPVMLESPQGSRTDVKVPYSTHSEDNTSINGNLLESSFTARPLNTSEIASPLDAHRRSRDVTCGATGTDQSNERNVDAGNDPENVYGDGEQEDAYVENAVYRELVLLFRELPKEMFVNRILLNEASCEVKLGEMRSSLFEHLKDLDDFPYGLQCMLKRRVATRSGDPVSVKLAYDIHTLMSVFEGADYSDMRELISSGSGKSQRSQSQSLLNETVTHCDSSSELKVLSDSINTLKAEVLHMKQSQVALETTRTKELQTMKSTILGLKSDLSSISSTVNSAVVNITLCAERIESEKSLGVTHVKNEVKLLKDSVKMLQDSILVLQTQASTSRATNSRRHRSRGKAREAQTASGLGSSPDLPTGHVADATDGAAVEPDPVPEMLNDSCSVHETVETGINSESTSENLKIDRPAAGTKLIRTGNVFSRVPLAEVPNPIDAITESSIGMNSVKNPQSVVNGHANSHPVNTDSLSVNTDNETDRSYRDVAALIPGNSQSRPRSRPIETRLTRNAGNIDQNDLTLVNHVNSGWNEGDNENNDDNFEQYVKKRAKRFYLGGFKPTITRQAITSYVNKRGPTVTWIRIWQSKRNPNNVVIRLNVEDNYLVHLLESRSFWPRGVTCRPWRDRNDRASNRNPTSLYRGETTRDLYGRSDIDEYNPFSPLRDETNWY